MCMYMYMDHKQAHNAAQLDGILRSLQLQTLTWMGDSALGPDEYVRVFLAVQFGAIWPEAMDSASFLPAHLETSSNVFE